MSDEAGGGKALDQYRLFGRTGLRVSPVGLGTMTFGVDWGIGADRQEARRIFDAYVRRGGNFIDTSPSQNNGTSEALLGEFIAGIRSQLVIGTKFGFTTRAGDPNASGIHRKSLVGSLEQSLARLKTDHVDLLWVQAWDDRTPPDEVMRALEDLVRAGKVLHLGICTTPAWRIAQADTLARARGWTGFSAVQALYSYASRSVERELLPMAEALDLAVVAANVLHMGLLTGKFRTQRDPLALERPPEPSRYDWVAPHVRLRHVEAAERVSAMARELGHTPAQVAFAWMLARESRVIPLVGARTVAQLEENLAALELRLPSEVLATLDAANALEPEQPELALRTAIVQGFLTSGAKVEKARRSP